MANEFGGRFLNTIEEHKRGFWFYFGNLFDYRFIIWVLFIPFGIIVGRKSEDDTIRKLTFFALVTVLTFILVISSSQTKLSWYSVPMYPFLALLVGIFIYHIFSILGKKEKVKQKFMPYFFLFLIFIAPYSLIMGKIYQQKQPEWKKDVNGVNYFLRNLLQDKIVQDNFTIFYEGTFSHGKFYLEPLLKKGKNISLKSLDKNLNAGEVVLFSQNDVKIILEANYELKILEEFNITGLYEIIDKKEHQQN
jgi:hypothetical protein